MDCGFAELWCLAGEGAEEVSVDGAAPLDGGFTTMLHQKQHSQHRCCG